MSEMMDLEQLASYLARDLREVTKMANRGYLPGHKVGGSWRFARAEINHWIETHLHGYSPQELKELETRQGKDVDGLRMIGTLLGEASVAVPLQARTRDSVLRELVSLAEQSWQVYDAQALLEALRTREELGSTALESGVAFPHPRRPLPNALGESVLAFGRTASPIPFGEPHGALTDVFFLVACRDDRTHLKVLARLSRMMLQPGFLDELRSAETASEAFHLLESAERALLELDTIRKR